MSGRKDHWQEHPLSPTKYSTKQYYKDYPSCFELLLDGETESVVREPANPEYFGAIIVDDVEHHCFFLSLIYLFYL